MAITRKTPSKRAKELLAQMTLEEKIGQIAQPFRLFLEYEMVDGEIRFSDNLTAFLRQHGGIGTAFSLFRADPWSGRTFDNGIPADSREMVYNAFQRLVLQYSRLGIPALVEENAPHGLQVLDGVVYPVSLAMGATFDREAVSAVGRCIAEECRTFGVHVPNLSVLDMACDPRFGRTEECLSEDPFLAAALSGSLVRGAKDGGAMVCCKHFCGQGAGQGGHCGGAAAIGERELREIHLPSTRAAVENGADFIMVSYNDVDGVRCHTNRHLMRDILQREYGFDGVIRADRMGVDYGAEPAVCAAQCLNAGVMLGLGDEAFTHVGEALERGLVSMETIDRAVYTLLVKKYESGVMDTPFIPEEHQAAAYLRSGVPQAAAYACAAHSLVLLKNEQALLPLKVPVKLAVLGEHAQSIYPILGDYTAPQRVGAMPNLFEAIQAQNPQTVVTRGWSFDGSEADFDHALTLAGESDAVILCLGGSSARDFSGIYNDKGQALATKSTFMDCGEGRDVCDLRLPGSQLALLRRLRKLGKPVVSVVIQGRPYLLDEAVALSDAVMIGWYPGQEGPHAIADALFGRINAFGRLPVSIPAASGALPACYNQRAVNAPYIDQPCLSDYPFGSGLHYGRVEYENLRVSGDASAAGVEQGAAVSVTVTARNTGDCAVDEVVMLFLHATDGSIVRRAQELKGFCRVRLEPGDSREVTFTLGREELEIYAADGRYAVEPGTVTVRVGGDVRELLMAKLDIKDR